MEIARERELEEEPKDVTELLQSYDKTLFLFMAEQYSIKWMHCIFLYVFTCR